MKITTSRLIVVNFIIVVMMFFGAVSLYYLQQQLPKDKSTDINSLKVISPAKDQIDSFSTVTPVILKPAETSQIINEQSCKRDSDCACGTNIKTKDCFLGNKKYVDTSKQCPDFCSGIAGKLRLKCLKNICQQVSN